MTKQRIWITLVAITIITITIFVILFALPTQGAYFRRTKQYLKHNHIPHDNIEVISFDGTTLVLKNVQPQAMIDSLYEVRKVGLGQMEITITAQEKKNVMIFDFQGKLISVDGILFDDLVTIK